MSRMTTILVAAGAVLLALYLARSAGLFLEWTESERVTPASPSDWLKDDRLADKQALFDPDLVDPRPLGSAENRWEINASAAVIRLDVPDIRSDAHPALRRVYPSYAEAVRTARETGLALLPGIALIGGKAKQFDDGLYAALDLYMVQTSGEGIRDIEGCVRRLLAAVEPGSVAQAWLWASLEVGGLLGPQGRPAGAGPLIEHYLAGATPVGFYEWNERLGKVYLFLSYLQQSLDAGLAGALAEALRQAPDARPFYERMLHFYSRLTGPLRGRSLLDVDESGPISSGLVAFLPSSDSKEARLFERLYPAGVPPGTELMRELMLAIRDGALDLTPSGESGWYEHQLFALESLILPERGCENAKLLLTRKYKLRLLEAFQAMVTKTRETHLRQSYLAVGSALPPQEPLQPRLRVEPSPTYYLRMARSYSFLESFLADALPDLDALVGLTAKGTRGVPLGRELANMRRFFHGLHLLSCEDIGLAPALAPHECFDPETCRALAEEWLERWWDDPDLAVDARVSVPIYTVPGSTTRHWATLGIRPILLEASYAQAPSWRPVGGSEWRTLSPWEHEPALWVTFADEFAEIDSLRTHWTRSEFQALCDRFPARQRLLAALRK